MNRHTAIIRRRGEVDRYGDPVEGPAGLSTELTWRGVIVAPRASSEVNNYSDTVITDYTALGPAEPAVLASDELLVDGVLYAVDGDPSVWSSPFVSWRPGQQVAIRRVRG